MLLWVWMGCVDVCVNECLGVLLLVLIVVIDVFVNVCLGVLQAVYSKCLENK